MNDLEYVKREGLSQFVDFTAPVHHDEDPFAAVRPSDLAMAPELPDLARIHRLIRTRKPFTVLEFGTGYSTVTIAHALHKNQEEWERLESKPQLRNRFMFKCFTVDASAQWLESSRARMPKELASHVVFHPSGVKIGTHNGQLCHFYESLPDIVPDFVYLDGPAPKDVQGSINGMTFHCDERTVMGSDLLLMESTLLPGAFILADGRTNNCRFLARNFTRDWKVSWDREGDITTFELDEDRLGPFNILASDVLGSS